MTRSFFLFAAILTAAASGVGCASEQDEATSETSDELTTSDALRSATIVKGSLNEGDAITVAYEPNPYSSVKGVPYLAVEVVPVVVTTSEATAAGGVRTMAGRSLGASLTVDVEGTFPGSPRVVVVDEEFHVLARTRAMTTAAGSDHAVLQIPNTPGKKLVLVRDMDWVAPMNFQVRAGL